MQFIFGKQRRSARKIVGQYFNTEIGAGIFFSADRIKRLLESHAVVGLGSEGQQLVEYKSDTFLSRGFFDFCPMTNVAENTYRLADIGRLHDQSNAICQPADRGMQARWLG